MDKTAIIIIGIVLVLAGVFVWAVGSAPKVPAGTTPTVLPAGIVLFYGDGCPHCKNVDDFVAANNITQKVSFTKLEVPFGLNTSPEMLANAAAAAQKAQSCGLDVSKGVGIPFLWDGNSKCFDGDVDVINFFKAQAGIK
jgi:hypothetical protein